MVLLIDTTENKVGRRVAEALTVNGHGPADYELLDTNGMNISHCIGCNYCWLKTPGVCTIKDDYAPLLRKISTADQVWLIADTKFGFVSYKAKNIVDRLMPLATMYLHFKNGMMRHVMRYDKTPDWGVIYTGEGDEEYLDRWCEKVAVNFDAQSLGAFSENKIQEAVLCM